MTDSAHDWLPERPLGVAATLSHPDELIGQVGDLLFDYQSQPDGIISLKEVLDPYEKFVVWKKKSLRDRPPSLRAASELVRRIDGLQPFHRQSDPKAHPLARLVLYTNHAKHRKPAITAVRLAAMYRDDDRPRSPRDVPQRPEEPR